MTRSELMKQRWQERRDELIKATRAGVKRGRVLSEFDKAVMKYRLRRRHQQPASRPARSSID